MRTIEEEVRETADYAVRIGVLARRSALRRAIEVAVQLELGERAGVELANNVIMRIGLAEHLGDEPGELLEIIADAMEERLKKAHVYTTWLGVSLAQAVRILWSASRAWEAAAAALGPWRCNLCRVEVPANRVVHHCAREDRVAS